MESSARRIKRHPCLFYLGLLALLGSMSDTAKAAVVFNQIPANLDLSYTSYSFSANHSRAIGNYVQLAGSERYLNAVTVTMVTWAKQSDFSNSTYADYSNTAGWNHYVEVVIYAVDNSGSSPVLNYVASSGGDVLIPWKPTVVPPGYPETGVSPYPYEGYAFNLSFQFDGSVQLPDQLVVSVNYDTQNYGYEPKGVPGPFNQLNVAADPAVTPTVGTDLTSSIYVSQKSGADYVSTLNGVSGGAAPMFKIEASASPDAYTAWIVSYGFANGGTGALRNDDPDGDGLNNLTEFAFGTDPTVNTQSPIQIESVSSTEVRVVFLMRNDGSMEYNPKSSTNLEQAFSSWTSFAPVLSSNQSSLPRAGFSRYEQILSSVSVDRTFVKIEAQEPTR